MGFSGASEVANNLPAHRQLPRSCRTMEAVARKQSALPAASITDAECKRELLEITHFYELFHSPATIVAINQSLLLEIS